MLVLALTHLFQIKNIFFSLNINTHYLNVLNVLNNLKNLTVYTKTHIFQML